MGIASDDTVDNEGRFVSVNGKNNKRLFISVEDDRRLPFSDHITKLMQERSIGW